MTSYWNVFPTITLTGYPLSSGISADFKNCSTYPALTLATNEARLSDVIYY